MESLKEDGAKLLGILATAALRPFIFNVSGPRGAGTDAIIRAILESYPPVVRRALEPSRPLPAAHPRGPSTGELARLTGEGDSLVRRSSSPSVPPAASLDEIEQKGRDGFVCVDNIHPSGEGAGRLRARFGSKLFSVALLPAQGGLSDQLDALRERFSRTSGEGPPSQERGMSQAEAIEYMLRNPTVMTPDGELPVFDALLVNDDASATLRRVLRLFENKFLDDG